MMLNCWCVPTDLLADLRPGGGMGQVEVDSNGNLVEGRGVAEQLADWLHRAHKTLDFVCDLSQPERREDGNMSSCVNEKYIWSLHLFSPPCAVSRIFPSSWSSVSPSWAWCRRCRAPPPSRSATPTATSTSRPSVTSIPRPHTEHWSFDNWYLVALHISTLNRDVLYLYYQLRDVQSNGTFGTLFFRLRDILTFKTLSYSRFSEHIYINIYFNN